MTKEIPHVDHRPLEPAILQPRSGPAELRTVLSSRRVQLSFAGDTVVVDAQLTVPGYDEPREGDRVLAITDDTGATWVVGVIRAPRPSSALDDALDAESPTVVRDRRGRVLFEYDPVEDRAVLHIPSGDLEVSVPEGALRMHARDGITLKTEGELLAEAVDASMEASRDLSLRGGRRVELEAARGDSSAKVAMQPGELTLVASVVAAAADRAELLAAQVGVRAQTLESHVDRLRTVAKMMDVRAGRIVERAKDVYREASGLSQTRAGRLRLVAKKTAQIVGENTLLKARKRMKVKGERIHLA